MDEAAVPDATGDLDALSNPVRRRVYDYVAGQSAPVRRDQVAEAVDISRTLAAYHLDRLAEAGLLTTGYARPEGRGGPGAGRPAKQYAPAQDEVSVTIPPRDYRLFAEILVDAVADADSEALRSALAAAAERHGRAVAEDGGDLLATLGGCGYEPQVTERGDIELRNCPFHRIVQRETALVCGVNRAFLRGVLAARDAEPDRVELAPAPGRCCVVVHPAGT
ncbi:helix-turn-helix transcriptional regulator [Glycomyces albidus]|jgi:predicted ArsR family transcriptional regulator|uniref:Helix-turn-helix domain-containing protein n=1 Tax=Glycomyces albidus TaxID=2656774 RepID=A0A6L5G4V3_9ACTN|nr:helix-turn-helix domain-containing protein [Glycomyces albidus]MQM24662.1 helix-turn-helix domain-containing protein [Glycomyces albidus]